MTQILTAFLKTSTFFLWGSDNFSIDGRNGFPLTILATKSNYPTYSYFSGRDNAPRIRRNVWARYGLQIDI